MPFLTTLIAMLLDTAVIPVLYHGSFTVPVTFAVVVCIALVRGRMYGLLYGMIGGMLTDITAGTLGVMMSFFMASGFLVGLLVDEESDRPITGLFFHLRRGLTAMLVYALGELVFEAYIYLITSSFNISIVIHSAARSALIALLTMLLCPALKRLYVNKKNETGHEREVRTY